MPDLTSKQLGAVISRRHPFYMGKLAHWNFLELCYEGGREWFETNIFRYIKEGEKDYSDRVDRAYRFNHTKEVVNLVNKYIFKAKIVRNNEDAPQELVKFWESATKEGGSIEKLTRQYSQEASIYGRVWVVVDNNVRDTVATKDEEGYVDAKPFAYVVKPQNALDMSFDDNGELNWILIYEVVRDDDDPFLSTGAERGRYRLWTKNEWFLLERYEPVSPSATGARTNKVEAVIVDSGVHGLGFVPVIPHDHGESDKIYFSPSLIDDIAYLDRACSNYLSNLDAIIQDQSFSQLAMPAQGVMPGESTYQKLIEMGTKRIFTFDGEHGGAPFYLSPDPRQAELIISAISKIINEIYHTVGMAGERTKQDNAIGIDNSSGVAKAYDFERVNALLTSKAFSIKRTEVKIAKTILAWRGIEKTESEIEEWLVYPETFDIRGIADEFQISAQLRLIDAPIGIVKEQMKVLVNKLFPKIKRDLKEKLMLEIEDMKDPIDELMSAGKNQHQNDMTGVTDGQNG